MSTLREQLDAMAQHVRDPAAHPGPPGIEARRLKIYSDLVFNNLDGLLAGNFPVIHKTLGDADWQALLRRFLANHHSHTPLFTELGRELVAFLEHEPDPQRPWLAELAQYEWAELGLQLSDAAMPAHDPDGDLLDGIPLLSPLVWPLAYRWPVDRIGPAFQPAEAPPEPTLLLLRRDTEGRVRFSKLSPLLFRLLERIATDADANGCEQLRQLADEAGQADFDRFLREAAPMLQRLHMEGVLIGTRIA